MGRGPCDSRKRTRPEVSRTRHPSETLEAMRGLAIRRVGRDCVGPPTEVTTAAGFSKRNGDVGGPRPRDRWLSDHRAGLEPFETGTVEAIDPLPQ
jgi:hypothetical protein